MALLRRFLARDSVEGALEVRLELAGEVGSYGQRMRRGLVAAAIATALAVASVTPGGIAVLLDVLDILRGASSATLAWTVLSGAQVMLMVLVWALGATILVFLVQSMRFVVVLRGRYATLERMGLDGPPEERGGARRRPVVGEDRPADPALAVLGLTRDVEEQVPQLDRMLKFGSVFALLLMGFVVLQAGLAAFGLSTIHGGWVLLVIGSQAAALVAVAVSIVAMVEIQGFLRYYMARSRSLGTFEAMAPCPVPAGTDPIDRYLSCLEAQGVIEEGANPSMPADLDGMDGHSHRFDAAVGGPGQRVLLRLFPRVPALDEVRALHDAAEDVAGRDGRLPRRVVALVVPGEEGGGDADIPDDVYRFVLESPILDATGSRARSVQVVSECEGFYCPVPFIAPDG